MVRKSGNIRFNYFEFILCKNLLDFSVQIGVASIEQNEWCIFWSFVEPFAC